MAKTPETVSSFLAGLAGKLRALQKEELEGFLKYKEEDVSLVLVLALVLVLVANRVRWAIASTVLALVKVSLLVLTLKGPGFFVYLKSGGGRIPPPPRISAAERRKILKFGTCVEFVNTNVLTKFQYLKSKHFGIMQIYVNYMHVFLFLTITDKIRPFGALKLF